MPSIFKQCCHTANWIKLWLPLQQYVREYYLTPENADAMNKFNYVGVMYCRFILFEMIVDLDCTLLKEILPYSLTITKYSQTSISGPLLSGHPLLNGHFSNSQNTVSIFTVNFTSIKRTQVPFRIPNWLILLYFTSIKRACSQLQCNILGYFDTMIRKPSPVSCSISSNTKWHT